MDRTPLLPRHSPPLPSPLILAALWTPVFLGALDGTVLATLVVPIGSHFNSSHNASYLATSYLLTIAATGPLYGRLSDILGAMLLAVALFTLGTIACAFAPSMSALIVARALAGTGGGGVMTVSSITVTDLVPLKHRGLYQGIANIMFGLGAGLGGPLGGWLNDSFGWRSAFIVQIPFLGFAFLFIAVKINIPLPEAIAKLSLSQRLRMIDYLGAITLVVTITALLLPIGLKNTEDLPWSHPLVWSLLGLSVASGTAFWLAESKWSEYPILPTRLITQRTPLFVALTNFFTTYAGFSMLYNVPLYFSAVRLSTAGEAGSHLLPNSIALSAGSLFAGWVMRQTGKYWLLIVVSNVLAVMSSLTVFLWSDSTSSFQLWFDIVPSGFGNSSVITSTLIAIIASVERNDVAVATGITYLARTVAQVLGVSLSGALVQGILTQELRKRITGPDSLELINKIRHSTAFIHELDEVQRKAAVTAYGTAVRFAFGCQLVVNILAVLTSIPIQEHPLPGTFDSEERSRNGTENTDRVENRSEGDE